MSSAITLTPFVEGGCYFECPRWHEGRWWGSDFYRHGVFAYDADTLPSGKSSGVKRSSR